MKLESPAFTRVEVEAFTDELIDHERQLLVERLEKATARLAALGPRISEGAGETGWSGHEVLAHIAVLSKFYGMLVHKISSGQLTELNLLENVNLRDVAGTHMAAIAPGELLPMVLADHQRTLKTLRSVEPAALRRAARLEDGTMLTAEFVARLPLISHLEVHLDQLEATLP